MSDSDVLDMLSSEMYTMDLSEHKPRKHHSSEHMSQSSSSEHKSRKSHSSEDKLRRSSLSRGKPEGPLCNQAVTSASPKGPSPLVEDNPKGPSSEDKNISSSHKKHNSLQDTLSDASLRSKDTLSEVNLWNK